VGEWGERRGHEGETRSTLREERCRENLAYLILSATTYGKNFSLGNSSGTGYGSLSRRRRHRRREVLEDSRLLSLARILTHHCLAQNGTHLPIMVIIPPLEIIPPSCSSMSDSRQQPSIAKDFLVNVDIYLSTPIPAALARVSLSLSLPSSLSLTSFSKAPLTEEEKDRSRLFQSPTRPLQGCQN
jgi:hypothetical protein